MDRTAVPEYVCGRQVSVNFYLRLLKTLTATEDRRNVVFSPFSALNSLLAVYEGTTGETKADFERALRALTLDKLDMSAYLSYWKTLNDLLRSKYANMMPVSSEIHYGNWPGFEILDSFRALAHENYGITICPVEHTPEQFKKYGQVSCETRTSISYKFDPSELFSCKTSIASRRNFHRKRTWKEAISQLGRSVRVPYIEIHENVLLNRDSGPNHSDLFGEDTVHVLRLSLDAQDTCLTIFEPRTLPLTTFIQYLSPATMAKVNRWTADEKTAKQETLSDCPSPKKRVISLPQFQISSTTRLEVPLHRMGFCDMFGYACSIDGHGQADLSAMATGKCLVESVRQDVAIDIGGFPVKNTREKTAAFGQTCGPDIKPLYRVKRPFVFFVEHLPTNTVLLAGMVIDPSITEHSVYPDRHWSYGYPEYKRDSRWTKKRKAVKQWLDRAMR